MYRRFSARIYSKYVQNFIFITAIEGVRQIKWVRKVVVRILLNGRVVCDYNARWIRIKLLQLIRQIIITYYTLLLKFSSAVTCN